MGEGLGGKDRNLTITNGTIKIMLATQMFQVEKVMVSVRKLAIFTRVVVVC